MQYISHCEHTLPCNIACFLALYAALNSLSLRPPDVLTALIMLQSKTIQLNNTTSTPYPNEQL